MKTFKERLKEKLKERLKEKQRCYTSVNNMMMYFYSPTDKIYKLIFNGEQFLYKTYNGVNNKAKELINKYNLIEIE